MYILIEVSGPPSAMPYVYRTQSFGLSVGWLWVKISVSKRRIESVYNNLYSVTHWMDVSAEDTE